MLIISVLFHEPFLIDNVFAVSPAFVQQSIIDETDDVLDEHSKVEIEGFPNIREVSYQSDGKDLKATIWFSFPFKGDNASTPVYGMLISTITGNAYQIKTWWNSSAGLWYTEVSELPKTGGKKVLTFSPNDHKEERNYVDLIFNLSTINFPSNYQVIFFAKNNQGNKSLLDYSYVTRIPPPQFSIATSPDSVKLSPGDVRTIELRIKSYTEFDAHVLVKPIQISGIKPEVLVPEAVLTSSGIATIPLKIVAPSNATVGSYSIPIIASIIFPSEIAYSRSSEIGGNLIRSSNLTMQSPIQISLTEPQVSLSIPTEALIGLYGVVLSSTIGWFVPSIASWINARRQRKNLHRYIKTIDSGLQERVYASDERKKDLDHQRQDILYLFIGGKINQSHYEILKDKISANYADIYMKLLDSSQKLSDKNKEKYSKNLQDIKFHITDAFIEGKINQSHYEILKDKIYRYEKSL